MLGRFSFIYFLFSGYYFKMRQRTHTKIVVLTTLPVSPNHSTLNQILIFFSHIVITTGCHQYLGRFGANHSLPVLAATQLSR
jgi:TRAP-type C4-dicarboxylate transport system permease small subunit